MNAHLNEWLNLLLRWFHLITGIAWIGSSFFFMWLDSSLEKPEGKEKVTGELWMTHSGGFYLVEKRKIGPGDMPKVLHWFKWEAALTWISGICLLGVVYYMTGGIFLVDPNIADIAPHQATLIGVTLLVVSWLVYDGLFQSPLGKSKFAGAVAFALLCGLTFGLTQIFSGRGAFMRVGAVIGTCMAANVWVRILPSQQKMIDATKEGRTPDYELGLKAKRRSIHNNYMTFPLLFIMFSNHFSFVYGHKYNWLLLLLLIIGGAGVKHVMNVGKSMAWLLVPVVALVVFLYFYTAPQQSQAQAESINGAVVSFDQVKAIVSQRCHPCHSASPTDATFGPSPVGINFDDPLNIVRHKDRIKVRVVIEKTMPVANKTNVTDEERAQIGQWIDAGAKTN